ncbi:MAG TPA: helix-turn-helix transcriptional regulator [Actinomycetota bacterium]
MPTRAEIGLGRALRKARHRQGLTLEEASRGTRLRAEYLDALERESFDDLPGDVYVRSFLRSYSGFLGLKPTKVVGVYEQAVGSGPAAPAPVDRSPAVVVGPNDPLPDVRHHFPWPMAAAVAVIVLVAAAAIGLLSRSNSSPTPALPTAPANLPVLPRHVEVNMVALRDVEARIVVDGVPAFEGIFREDEARSFRGDEEIEVWLATGKLVRLEVNGENLGKPGQPVREFLRTFDRDDFRGDGSGRG